MKNISALILLGVLYALLPNKLCSQDIDQDGLSDQLEAALAKKFAPEWRFNKKIPNPPVSFLNNSNQNIDELNFPSSVEYLVSATLNKTGNFPGLLFRKDTLLVPLFPPYIPYWYPVWDEQHFSNINSIPDLKMFGSGPSALDTVFGGCIEEDPIRSGVFLNYPENLPGEPNTFPTYFHADNIDNDRAYITYFIFAPWDDKHEGAGYHRGDWERFTIVIKDVNMSTNNIDNSKIDFLLFAQHEGIRSYLKGDSKRLRLVNGTHPKVYISIGSHAIYPEPGALKDYRVTWWLPDVYDDEFFGNGLIVQSWNQGRELINLGETDNTFPNTKWNRYKGSWGPLTDGLLSETGPRGPLCKWTNEQLDYDLTGILSWEEWITNDAGGYLKQWNDIYLDCYQIFSNNYVPNPGYDCTHILDWRHTCDQAISSDLSVWGTLQQLVDDLPDTQKWQVCVMPGKYPGPAIINKKMTLKVIEGPATFGME